MVLNLPWLAVLRIGVGSLFVISGAIKLSEPSANFHAVIEGYEMIEGTAAQLLAQVLPWLELIGGLFVLLGLWTRQSLFLMWSMISLFIGVVAQALVRKLPITECGCFGEALALPLGGLLIVDLTLWFACFVMMKHLSGTNRFSIDQQYDRS